MALFSFAKVAVGGLAAALIAVPLIVTPVSARVSDGAAVGIGLGAFALGTAAGAAATAPYYGAPYGYGYYPPPAPAYYAPPAPYYPPARSCWDPYYRRYYAC